MNARPELFGPVRLGDLELPNRLVMAPLTRSRSTPDGLQTPMHATYYAQRAGAGLIVGEATQISPEGQGYAWTPGIHTDAQTESWRPVTDAVHAAGGRIVCQLWHVGAISHPVFQPGGGAPVSSSAFRPDGDAFVGDLHPDGPTVRHPEARALRLDEIPRLVRDYVAAARHARAAGFDGVELHAANGYLLDQFLRSSVNRRTDRYGGSVENRIRLVAEVVDALCGVWAPGRIGVRLTPSGGPGGSRDADPETLYVEAARALSGRGLAYLHVVRPNTHGGGDLPAGRGDALPTRMRDAFGGPLVANGGFDAAEAARWVREGLADVVSFGRAFLANPDLPARIAAGGLCNEPDADTFYGGGATGYTDYPALEPSGDR